MSVELMQKFWLSSSEQLHGAAIRYSATEYEELVIVMRHFFQTFSSCERSPFSHLSYDILGFELSSARIALKVMEYDFNIVYHTSVDYVIADGFSCILE